MNQQQQVASGCLWALHNRCVVLTMACLAKTMGAVEQLAVMIWMIDKLHSYLLHSCSMSLSRLGHHMTIQALPFILDVP